jgi:hypothetical protein
MSNRLQLAEPANPLRWAGLFDIAVFHYDRSRKIRPALYLRGFAAFRSNFMHNTG